MQFSSLLDKPSKEYPIIKSSPTTSAGTQLEIQEQINIEQSIHCQKQQYQLFPVNKKYSSQCDLVKHNSQIKQQKFQQIESEIMAYFEAEGVHIGNPGDFKKQFNKKLHKRVAMMDEVNEVVTQKANAGSSLLTRRLHKKMTITL